MNKLPIIAFAPHPWHESQWMNRQQLLSRLGKRGWPIVYSHGALDIWKRHNETWKQSPLFGKTEFSDNICVHFPGKLLPRWETNLVYDQLAISYHINQLKKSLRINRTSTRNISFIFHPSFWPYIKALNSDFVIFHIYDSFQKSGGWDSLKNEMYEKTLARADLITASSESMVVDLPTNLHTKIKILHNGVDTDLFNANINCPCPSDLLNIPHPRIVNTGTINRKIDLPLILKIAKKRPQWHWVLIGPVYQNEFNSNMLLSNAFLTCQQLENVHFLGEKSRFLIPSYISHADVTTMNYRIKEDEWYFDGYPLKVNEYLAMGKPTISSPINAIKTHFADIVDIANGEAEWIAAIDNALTNGGVGTPEQRKALAIQNSWDNRVNVLEKWMFEFIQNLS